MNTATLYKSGWITVAGTFLLGWVELAIVMLGTSLLTGGEPDETFGEILMVALLGPPMMLATYGFFFWILLVVAVIILDNFLFAGPVANIRKALLAEWGFISALLTGCAVVLSSWMFLIPVLPLLLSQLYRERRIFRLMPGQPVVASSSP